MKDLINLYNKVQTAIKTDDRKRLWIRRSALLSNLRSYFQYASAQKDIFDQTANEYYGDKGIAGSRARDLENKFFSAAISFYNFLRIVLSAARFLSEETILNSTDEVKIKELLEYRNQYNKWASKIIKIRNNVGSHPHEIREFNTGFPGSWGSYSKVRFNIFNLETLEGNKGPELNLVEDMEIFTKYIKDLCYLLNKNWFPESSES